jgi:ferritin-like metal-binding protein YciE
MAAELLIAWLNDAYAMEQAQAKTLEGFIEDFEEHTEIRSELRQHLLESEDQIKDLKLAIEDLGGKVAPGRSNLSEIIASVQEMSVSPYHDERVKDLLLLHATEHYEHITYMAIAEGARQLGEDDIADTCERIADEEAAMAEWAEEQIPAVVATCMNAAIKEE